MTDIQKTRILRIGSFFLAALILFCAMLSPEAAAKSTDEYYENAVLFWTNVERTRNGLSELKTAPALQSAADTRAAEIVSKFDHTRPNGSKWSTAIKSAGISYSNAAENIAAGKAAPYDTVKKWMDSSTHRSNILSSSYSYMAAGYKYASSSTYTYYWTQEFVGGASLSGTANSFYVAPSGVSTDKSSLSVSVGGSTTLAGIPSPVYATEVITCTSSNPNVAKVTGTSVNVFTIKGVANGTANLTVKCGSYSKTVSITVGTGGASSYNSNQPFVDVSTGAVYYNAVMWAYKNDITGGTDATHFSPNKACTRGQVVTFLWRAAGCPSSRGASNPFVDVKSGSYCYDAVMWAYRSGITDGVDATHFKPDKVITREQFVTMLWNYHGSPTVYISNPFRDVSSGSYFYNAVLWAYKNNVTTGIDSTHFGVGDPCLRYQVVLFLYRDLA